MIFLVGMPAAGKTYWGNKIADAFSLPFTDLDDYIEQREGLSIPEIFSQQGESGFREKETAALQQLISTGSENMVIACGGGTPVHGNNMQLMKQAGCTIYMDVKLDTLLQRLKSVPDTRPLLQSANIPGALNELVQVRRQFYEQADYILAEEDLSLNSFRNIIDICIKKH